MVDQHKECKGSHGSGSMYHIEMKSGGNKLRKRMILIILFIISNVLVIHKYVFLTTWGDIKEHFITIVNDYQSYF